MFQPPFQSGRTSPETSQSRLDLVPMPTSSPEFGVSGDGATGGSNTAGANAELDSQSSQPESEADYGQASAAETDSLSSTQASLSTAQTSDSGYSELSSTTSCSTVDPHAEKETSCEKTVRPEGDIATYDCIRLFQKSFSYH